MTTWTPIAKGDRRPEGYVLVTYTRSGGAEDKLRRAIWGVAPAVEWRVTVARWRKDYQRWYADSPRLDTIPNVIAWAPLPEPYQHGEQNE